MEIFNIKSKDLSADQHQSLDDAQPIDNTQPDAEHPFLITNIKAAVRMENRVNVYINGAFDFSLEIPQVVDLHLKVGKALSAAELKKCRKESEFGKLYHHSLEYCLTRPHSVKEVWDHLVKRRKNRELANRQAVKNRERTKEDQIKYKLRTREQPLYTDADIERVISRLIEKKYLDDARFAEFYVENRFVKKGISKKRLYQELAKKGIEKDLIDQALAKNPRDESEEIQKIIKRKRDKYTRDKLISYLTRQGFDYQQSKDAVLGMDSQN